MQPPDYYSVMEKKIQYYSRKYDPYSRYVCESLKLQQKELKKQMEKAVPRKRSQRVKESLREVVAMFLAFVLFLR